MLLAAACAPEQGRAAPDTAPVFTTAPDPSPDEPDDTEGTGDEPADADTTDATVPDDDGGIAYAQDITITAIEANQGVAIPLLTDAGVIAPADRAARVVARRDLLVRVYWSLHADFVPRPIEAVVVLTAPDGTTDEVSAIHTPAGPSAADDLLRTFSITIPADRVQPEVALHVELRETAGAASTESAPNRAPAEPLSLDAHDGPHTLRVRLVPVKHDLGPGCPEAPVFDDDTLWIYWDLLFGQTPTESVEIDVRAPMVWTQPLTEFDALLDTVSTLHAQDGADPSIFYYAMFTPCDAGPADYDGMAIDIPTWPTVDNAWTRTAVGRWYDDPWYDGQLMVHELGHTLGRWHVTCTGEELEPDAGYPHPGGALGGFGWSPGDGWLSSDATRDYMSYCTDQWVSDYGWEQVLDAIAELSSWPMAAPVGQGRLLVGSVRPDGTEHWVVTRGTLDRPATPGHTLELTTADGTEHVPLSVRRRPDSDAMTMVAALPAGAIDTLVRTSPDGRHALRLSAP